MTRRSPLAIVVLALLAEEPMHPYRIQQMLTERRKDQVANIAQRNSVYQTIDRLHRDGLVAVRETARDERRPERTVYEITPDGTTAFRAWVLETLATPAREYPIFPAALSETALFPPEEVLPALEARLAAMRDRLAVTDADQTAGAYLPRVLMLEVEHERALVAAEVTWLESVVADLRAGRLTWSEQELRALAASS